MDLHKVAIVPAAPTQYPVLWAQNWLYCIARSVYSFCSPLDSKEGWGPVYLGPCVSWERDITNTWMNENEYYHCIFGKKNYIKI